MEIRELTQLLEPPNNSFEGHLVLSGRTIIWTLHFAQGRLLYAVDNQHPVRRWNRNIQQYFPNFKLDLAAAELSNYQHWQLYLLDQGFRNQQLSLVRTKLMLRMVVQECLFELSQRDHIQQEWQPATLNISRFCRTIALSQWEIQMILNKIKDIQQECKNIDLTIFNPILAPTLKKPVDPQRLLVPHQYITGKYTLWAIAAKLEKSLVDVIDSLLPLFQDQILELQPISDLPLTSIRLLPLQPTVPEKSVTVVVAPNSSRSTSLPSTFPPASTSLSTSLSATVTTTSPAKSEIISPPAKSEIISPLAKSEIISPDTNNQQPLIACIDDSPVLAHSLKKILASGGYRTLIIQEPMQGFSQLIEHMPSLILLDVMLPHTDGYNVCRFLRDTPVFKETPIIILTGRSKPVDRARASMAGATEFLVKPPEPKELLAMIRQHLDVDKKMSG